MTKEARVAAGAQIRNRTATYSAATFLGVTASA